MDISGILLGTVLCVFSTVLIFQRLQWRNTAKRSENWPATEATVISSTIEQRNCDVVDLFEPSITYRYCVNGRTFIGSNVSFELPSFSMSRAKRLVTRYRPGTAISIRYDPANPKYAVLEKAKPHPPIGAFEFSTGMLGLGILIYELHLNGMGSLFL